MAYRYGNRYQMQLLPQRIEEYITSDDPVRAYDAFVEALDLRELGITLDPLKVKQNSRVKAGLFSIVVKQKN